MRVTLGDWMKAWTDGSEKRTVRKGEAGARAWGHERSAGRSGEWPGTPEVGRLERLQVEDRMRKALEANLENLCLMKKAVGSY